MNPRSIVLMPVPSITPCGNIVYNDSELTFSADGTPKTVILSAGSVVYVGPEQEPKQVLWAEATAVISGGVAAADEAGDDSEPAIIRWGKAFYRKALYQNHSGLTHALFLSSSTLLLRVFRASLQASRTRKTLVVDYANSEAVRADQITFYQIRGDNQVTGHGLVDHMKTPKFRAEMFPAAPDPQATLQLLRTLTVDGMGSEHKKLWLQLNTEALIHTYVTSRSRTSSEKWATGLRAQAAYQTGLYYDIIIDNGPVPEFNTAAFPVLTIMPVDLVVKLKMVKQFREDPGGGGREEALTHKRAAAAAAAKEGPTSGKKRKKRLSHPPDGVDEVNWFRNAGNVNKDGTSASKPGRKTGTTVNHDGSVSAPPGSAKKPVANKVVAAPSSKGGGGSSSSSSSSGTSATGYALAAMETEKVRQLQDAISLLQKDNTELKEILAADHTTATMKDAQMRSELFNRGNIAKMAGKAAVVMEEPTIEGFFQTISPLKLTGPGARSGK